ncbi:hypothetical protein GA0070616_1506 [Micromonospora nigra]|uniref:MYXO-CTERM domain-containing protein n=1 Tax=Micromonospora nigra TaxID=145857 RepID=A0A1C6RMK0_9ACTN|nr:hypothetical protein [Micromonospora nigra]SCL18420.1 hypothetical protein GA0070616_1506 [Micromonospora nigra]
MANRMLGKVVAGAALGGASLLVFSPTVALADGPQPVDEGKVYAKPHAVKPGHEVKLLQVCEEPQEHAYVWSEVTGKVKLKPAHDHGDRGGDRGDWRDRDGKDRGGDDNGRPKPPTSSPQPTPTTTPPPANGTQPPAEGDQPSAGGQGGGDVAPDGQDKDRKGYEHGQDAEAGRDDKGHEGYGRGDWMNHDDYLGGADSRDRKDHDSDWAGGSDERDHGWEHKKDFVYYGEAVVSPDAAPGTYELEGSCGTGELVVLPHGGVDGGDGGVGAGTDRELATAGASLVGAAALGGLVLMRRRRADASVA